MKNVAKQQWLAKWCSRLVAPTRRLAHYSCQKSDLGSLWLSASGRLANLAYIVVTNPTRQSHIQNGDSHMVSSVVLVITILTTLSRRCYDIFVVFVPRTSLLRVEGVLKVWWPSIRLLSLYRYGWMWCNTQDVLNMSMISKVDRCRSISILINRQISEIDKSRSQNFLWLSTLIDFNRQLSETQKRYVAGDIRP